MKLADINPFLPKDPTERKKFTELYKKELKEYRKRVPFLGGLLVALIFSLILIYRLDTIEHLIMIPIVFGIAIAHDTITSHFVKRIAQITNSNSSTTLAEPVDGGNG